MSFSKFNIASIDKIIAHEIHPKTDKKNAYAVTKNELLEFTKAEKTILIKRIYQALTNATKTFQLEYEDKAPGSVFSLLEKIGKLTDKEFIDETISLAKNLADAHFRTKIPGGYCLIGVGHTIEKNYFFFVIKAELQEVFNISDNKLNLIKDVFLSPAKEFYKLGYFVKQRSEFVPYMYDDQFQCKKRI